MPKNSTSGHVIQGKTVREASAFDRVLAWTAQLPKQSRRLSEQLGLAKQPPDPAAEGAWSEDDEEETWSEAAAIDTAAHAGEQSIAAHWHVDKAKRRLLLLVYATGIQVWHIKEDGTGPAVEIANVRLANVKAARLASTTSTVRAYTLTNDAQGAILVVHDLSSGSAGQSRSIVGEAMDLQVNDSVVAIICISAIHLLSPDHLEELPNSPLDVPFRPIVALSNGRLFAYASTAKADSPNILAHQGKWRAPSPEDDQGGSETSRAIRAVAVKGARAVGNAGMAYLARSAPAQSGSSSSADSKPAALVKVIDLKTMRPVASFVPTDRSVSLLSFDPSGSLLLTASTGARSFHVFELREHLEPVWHRYDLVRGSTFGQAMHAAWSEDGRFVSLSMAKGTAHIYAISPFGGAVDLAGSFVFPPKNAEELPSLSLLMDAIARVRPPESGFQASQDIPVPTAGLSAPAIAVLAHGQSGRHLALFYPHLATLLVTRLSLETRSGVSAITASGLTHLLRTQQAVAAARLQHVAAFPLQRAVDWPEVQDRGPGSAASQSEAARRFAAQAELHTFSRSTRVNSASVYTSHQVDFATFDGQAAKASMLVGQLQSSDERRIDLRRHVDISKVAESIQLRDALEDQPSKLSTGPSVIPAQAALRSKLSPAPIANSITDSSPSSGPQSLSIEEQEVDAQTPATEPVVDEGWGFDEELHLDKAAAQPAAPAEEPFLMDEHKAESLLPVPIEPTQAPVMERETSSGKRRRKKRDGMSRSPVGR